MPPKRKTYIKNCTGRDCEVEKKKVHKLYLRISFYILFFLFFCSLVYMLFFSTEMQIINISLNGTKNLDSAELKSLVDEKLQGKYLGFLPKNNYILTSKSSIEGILKDRYKKIRSVEITKIFPNTIVINVDEHESLLVWCKSDIECYMLDEDGVAYSDADFNSPELQQNKLLKISDRSGADVSLNSKIMEENYEKYLLNIKNELLKLDISIEDNFSTPSRMAEEIEVKSTGGYSIFLSTQFSLESAMKTLSAVFKKEIPKEKNGELEYVDLRSEYKAFYKYKNLEEENKQEENKIE